jgi:hypothetical protein
VPIRSPKWFFAAALVLTAPETPGVFELWDGEERVYVGAAHGAPESLRTCLVREMRERHATHFSWEITYRPDCRQQELLEEHLASHHRTPRFNGKA